MPQPNTPLPLSCPHFTTTKPTFHGWYFRRASSPGEPATWTRYHKTPMAYSSDELGRIVRDSLAASSKAKKPARSAAEQYRLLSDGKKDMVDALVEEVRSRERGAGVAWTLACVTQDARHVVRRRCRARGGLVRTEEARQVDVVLRREVERDDAVIVAGPVRTASPVGIDVHAGEAQVPASARLDSLPLPLDDHASGPRGILKSSTLPPPTLPPYPTNDGDRGDYSPVFSTTIQPPPPVPMDPNDGYPPPPPTPPGARHAVFPARAPEPPRPKQPSPPYPVSPPLSPSVPVAGRPSVGKVEDTKRRANDRAKIQSATVVDLVDTESSDSEADLPPPPPPMPQPKAAKQSRSSRRAVHEMRSEETKLAKAAQRQRTRASKQDSVIRDHNPNIINITVPRSLSPSPSPSHAHRNHISVPRSRGRRHSRSRSRSIESFSVKSRRSRSNSSSRHSTSTASTRVRTIVSSTSAASEGYDPPPRSLRTRDDSAAVYVRVERGGEEAERWRRTTRMRSRSRNSDERAREKGARDVYRWTPAAVYSSRRQRSPSPLLRRGDRRYRDGAPGVLYAVNYGHDRRDYPPLPPPPHGQSEQIYRGRMAPQMTALPVPALAPQFHTHTQRNQPLAYEEWAWQVPRPARSGNAPMDWEVSASERTDLVQERPARRTRSRGRSRSRSRSRSRVTYVRRQRQRETKPRPRSRSRERRNGERVAVVDGEQGAMWPWGVDGQGQGRREGVWRGGSGIRVAVGR